MKYYDYHCHSNISFDGRTPIAEICAAVIKAGGNGVTFTEHIECSQDFSRGGLFNWQQYHNEIEQARQMFANLTIGMGVEAGWQPLMQPQTEAAVTAGNYDFVLGALHYIDDLPIYNGTFSEGKTVKQANGEYFAALLAAVSDMADFDVLAHIDLIRRDEQLPKVDFVYNDYADYLDPLLKQLIERGKGLEVNTGGWRCGCYEPHPAPEILRRYRELGGEIITCGSDSHVPRSLFYRIKDAYGLIEEAGFKYISLFDQRKLKQVPFK